MKAKSCYVGRKSIINYAYNKSTISNCFIIMSFMYHKVVCIGFYSFAIFQGICFILQILTGWFSNPVCDSRLQYVWSYFFPYTVGVLWVYSSIITVYIFNIHRGFSWQEIQIKAWTEGHCKYMPFLSDVCMSFPSHSVHL